MYDPHSDCVSRAIREGNYEEFELRLVSNLIGEGSCVIDVGAHIGFWTTKLAKTAFEPDPNHFKLLKQNTQRLNNVTLFNCGLGASNQSISISRNQGNSGDNRPWLKQSGFGTFPAQIRKLDDVINPYSRIDFVKIDTQGYEVNILKGMRETIARQNRLILLAEFWPDGLEGCGNTIGELQDLLNDFDIYRFIKNGIQKVDWLCSLFDYKSDHFGNLLCFKKR